MIIQEKAGQIVDMVQNVGVTDYVDSNGIIVKNSRQASIMIRSSSDLSELSDYPPGTIAYTVGFGSMWQKSAAGVWTSM